MISPLKNLLGARLKAARNRLRHQPPKVWLIGGATAALFVALWLALGHAAAPSLVVPPVDLATPIGLGAEELPAGAAALEAAFWLTALLASVLNFRFMELLFRRKDIRSLENYPVPLSALFVDRLLLGLAEALVAGLFCALFFVPLFWHGAALAAVLSASLLVGGLVATTAIAFAVLLVSGASLARATAPASATGPRRPAGDLYGGSGQVFLYAPGVALGVSIVAILFFKLILGEVLRHEGISRIAEVGLAAVAGFVLLCIYLAFRDFVRSFPAMAARFREADIIGFDVDLPYQKSAFTRPARLEGLLSGAAPYLLRAHILQYGRRYMIGRYIYVLGWLAAIWALWSLSAEAFPGWIAAVLPVIALAILANPWRRVATYHSQAIRHLAIPVTGHEDLAARSLFTAREAMILTMPYAVLVVAIRGGVQGLWTEAVLIAAVALTGALGLNALMGWVMRLTGPRPLVDTALPIVAALALSAVAAFSLEVLLVAGLLLTLTHWMIWTRPHDLHAVAH